MPTDLKGWHLGERSIQSKLGFDKHVAAAFTWIENGMTDEQTEFHSRYPLLLPLTTLDSSGRPWSSLLGRAKEQSTGDFIRCPTSEEMHIQSQLYPGDPLLENLRAIADNEHQGDEMLLAGLGIDLSTRRRNKFAGQLQGVDIFEDNKVHLRLRVNQAIGNCPKYINVRNLVYDDSKRTAAHIVSQNLSLPQNEKLPESVINFVHSSDTAFLGTFYRASEEAKNTYPSHLGMNHRGGRVGFIRVMPSDSRTLVIPDYSGNRLLTSLGNIEATPLASLTFYSFDNGDVLYLTGEAQNLVGPAAQKLMPRQNVVTTLHTTGYTLMAGALPLREEKKDGVQRSPYSPPVRYLAEERTDTNAFDDVTALLQKVELHTPAIASFTFRASQPMTVVSGQAAVLGFTELVGERSYAHMAMPGWEVSVNDDRIRTWTISSSHSQEIPTEEFVLTMRERPGGTVTGALFAIARKLAEFRPDLLIDTTTLALRAQLLGVTGHFVLPPQVGSQKILWVAGGIGITPFLSMLGSLHTWKGGSPPVITIVFSTKEPDVFLPLIASARPGPNPNPIPVTVHVFTDETATDQVLGNQIKACIHKGRVPSTFFTLPDLSAPESLVYLCGPESYEKSMMEYLTSAGVQASNVVREEFTY